MVETATSRYLTDMAKRTTSKYAIITSMMLGLNILRPTSFHTAKLKNNFGKRAARKAV